MTITRLSDDDQTEMAKHPELAMGIQVAERQDGYVVVVNDRVVIKYGPEIVGELDNLNKRFAELSRSRKLGDTQDLIVDWINGLNLSKPVKPVQRDVAFSFLGFIHLGPIVPLPPAPPAPPASPPPPAPPAIYGHLPFHGIASGNDRFYRYECYPTSRRIVGKTVAGGTFAVPELDAHFINSGLGAVARYALPSLLPACWKHELIPPSSTLVHYGASVPLYGQSGGGVEVFFPNGFTAAANIPLVKVEPIF
jgi:hypothetical protein